MRVVSMVVWGLLAGCGVDSPEDDRRLVALEAQTEIQQQRIEALEQRLGRLEERREEDDEVEVAPEEEAPAPAPVRPRPAPSPAPSLTREGDPESAPAPEGPTGTLQVAASRRGARVRVDGEVMGTTPLLVELPVDVYTVEVEGYAPTELSIRDGERKLFVPR